MIREEASQTEFPEPVDWHNRFEVGIRAFPGPEHTQPHHMFHLVAYDIADPSRLRRVARTCEAYGVRIEKSVFQCDLPRERFEDLWLELIDLIDDDEDAVVAYRICQACLRQAESMGIVRMASKPLCYVF